MPHDDDQTAIGQLQSIQRKISTQSRVQLLLPGQPERRRRVYCSPCRLKSSAGTFRRVPVSGWWWCEPTSGRSTQVSSRPEDNDPR